MSALELHSPQAIAPPSIGRFRLVDRRPSPGRRRARRSVAHPFRSALLYTALPALLLVAYVALVTTAVHAGYQEQRLSNDIERLRVENQALQARARSLQTSARILHRATRLGMQPPVQIIAIRGVRGQGPGVRK